jgi:hypothetical protein
MGPVDIQHFDVVGTSPTPTNTIQSGDFVANVSDKAVPASAFTWTTDLATTQTNFAASFLGASESRSLPEADIRGMRVAVNMDGTYEVDCTSANYTVGQYVGLAKDTGNNLLSSKVEACTTKVRAIGVVLEAGTSLTRVKIRLINTAIKR